MSRTILLICALLFITAAPSRAQVVGAQGVTVDFQDADIRFVLSALAEAGNLNLTFGPLQPRAITLRMADPVPPANILPLLRSLAESNGLQVIEDGGLIRVEAPATGAGTGQTTAAGQTVPADLRLFVHRLRQAQAARLAATLQSLFGNQVVTPQAASGPQTLSSALRQQQIQPLNPDSIATPASTTLPGLTAVLQAPVQIVPDELTNSLLVRATPADWEVIEQAIQSLDVRPLQVLIEGLIVEVRRTDDFDFSVSASGRDREVNPRVTGELEGSDVGGLNVEILRLGNLDIDVVLSALASRGEVNIISRPVITAQNNQEARILIGSERPFIQVFRTLPTDNSARDQIIQYRDVGTSLTVKPTINVDGYVNLQISQEVSTATSEEQFGAPVISTREASTLLYVRDGQTAVIGGLIDQQQERSRSGIPFLKDIPVLGALFGTTRRAERQTELFLFLTPHVIQSDEDLDRVREGVQEATERLPTEIPSLPIGSSLPVEGNANPPTLPPN